MTETVEITLVETPGGRLGVELRNESTIINGVAKPGAAVGFRDLMDGKRFAIIHREMSEKDCEQLVDRLDAIVTREID